MKKTFSLVISLALWATTGMAAKNFLSNEMLSLDIPSCSEYGLSNSAFSPEVMRIVNAPLNYDLDALALEKRTDMMSSPVVRDMPELKMDFDFFTTKTNPDVPAFKVMDDLTFVGVPIFVAGILAKPEKKSFRQNNDEGKANTMLLTNFKTGIDDYSQYFGPVATVGLKLAGYEGRSDWPRLAASAAMSYAIMAAFVNGIKYTAKEMRPDGSSANSWPSGHTATSFVGATLLHKEYGLTRSPWFSVAGYGVATATGVMRVLNNRHWVSDVLSGAGIGIMSTELGYALSDILFKQKGLLRGNINNLHERPSFFAISMGLGLGTNEFSFTDNDIKYTDIYEPEEDSESININFHTATTVDAEGAYFFNKYVGIGGRLRVRAMTAKNWDQFTEYLKEGNRGLAQLFTFVEDLSESDIKVFNSVLQEQEVIIESDHLTDFSGSVGLYLNLPIGPYFDLGTKALIGRSITQELDINSKVKGQKADVKYQVLIVDGAPVDEQSNITGATSAGAYEGEWDILTLGGEHATTFGTGLSLTYKYKSNFSWRIFADYDYCKRNFTLTYDPFRFLRIGMPNAASFLEAYGVNLDPIEYVKKKKTNYFTIGASFAVNF